MKKSVKNFLVLLLSFVMVLSMAEPKLAETAASDSSSEISSEESETSDTGTQAESASEETEAVQDTSAPETEETSSDKKQDSSAVTEESSAEASESDNDSAAGTKKYTRPNDYTVTATYGEDAGLPADAELKVSEITNSSEIKEYTQKVEDQLDGTAVSEARFFDICFVKDGKEIEPKGDVDIRISLSESLESEESSDVKAVHFEETSGSEVTPEILNVESEKDNAGNVTEVRFTQSSFSVTGIVVADGSWPVTDGEHVVIVQGSNNNYYALNHDGSLTKVSVDESTGSKNVTFPDFTDADQVKDYIWTTAKAEGDSGTISYNDGQSDYYLYPTQSSAGVVNSNSDPVYISNGGQLFRYYNDTPCYLSVNNEQAVGIYDVNYPEYGQSGIDDAAKVLFADSFTVDDTQTDPDPGTDSPDEENLDAPEAVKTLTDNENGTYDLSLSIKGKARTQTDANKAEVVVVFDESNSMNNQTANGNTRLSEAKTALNELTETLLSDENKANVSMKLIRFHTTATSVSDWTSDAGTFEGYYQNDTTPGENGNLGGTNWGDALQEAVNADFSENADKYVIFISDGDPTFYNNAFEGIGGKGYDSGFDDAPANISNCYSFAKDDAYNLVKQGINFYTVGIYNQNIGKMEPLTSYAYSGSDTGSYPSGRYQVASDTDALKKAFANIITEITRNYNYANVTLNDQMTAMTMADVIPGNGGKFRYTVIDDEGNIVTVTDNGDGTYSYSYGTETRTFNGAVCDEDGKVTWSMDTDSETPFLLDNGYTYTCSFTVWPNQEAYDLVADLNNGIKTYEELTDDEKSQIVPVTENGSTTYRLKTNTDGTNATYRTGVTVTENGTSSIVFGDLQEYDIANPDPVPLTGMELTIKKVWDDAGDSSYRPDSVKVNVIRDKGTGNDVTTLPAPLILSEDNDWTATYYISPGLIVDEKTLNAGHTYDIEEVDPDFLYELDTETYNPFLIDSNSEIYNGKSTEDAEGNSTKITTLTATNHLRDITSVRGSVQFAGVKSIENMPEDMSLAGYVFNVTDKDTGKIIATADSQEDGTINYPAISYTLADAGKTFTYVVSEENAGKTIDGVTYDDTSYEVTVKVEDDGKGGLTTTASDNAETLNFTNKYAAGSSVTFAGQKTFKNGTLNGNDFSFVITENGKEIATATNSKDGTINYPTISYTLADTGTHTYTVCEVNGGKIIDGVKYDDARYTVNVEVSDNGDGTLTVKADSCASDLNFTNAVVQGTNIKVVKTGDTTPIAMYGIILAVSAAAIIILAFRKKKDNV